MQSEFSQGKRIISVTVPQPSVWSIWLTTLFTDLVDPLLLFFIQCVVRLYIINCFLNFIKQRIPSIKLIIVKVQALCWPVTWKDALRHYPGQPRLLWLLCHMVVCRQGKRVPFRDKFWPFSIFVSQAVLLKRQAGLCPTSLPYSLSQNSPHKLCLHSMSVSHLPRDPLAHQGPSPAKSYQ